MNSWAFGIKKNTFLPADGSGTIFLFPLIDMFDAAPAWTPSAPMLNSSLAHQHRQRSWGGGGLGSENTGLVSRKRGRRRRKKSL